VTARRSVWLLGHRTFRWVVLIYLLALGVRLVYFQQVRHNPLYDWPTLDENTNHQAALAVLNGTDPAKSFLKAPLHTYYLVGVYRLFGPKPDSARLIQVFLSSLWAPLIFLIAERLFGRPTDLVAGVLAALFWTFVFFSTELLDVGIAGLFYLLTACLVVRMSDASPWKWFWCGLSLGLGAITRPNILVVAPLLAGAIVWVAWRRARSGLLTSGPASRTGGGHEARALWLGARKGIITLALGCGVVIAPVTLRNRIVGGEWVLIAAYGGVNFYLANNPEADAKNVELLGLPDYVPSNTFDPNDPYDVYCFTYRSGCDYTRQKLGRPCTRGEMDRTMMALGRAYVRQYPSKFIGDSLKRLCWFFNAYEYADNKDLYQFTEFSRLLSGLSWFHYGILCPLVLLGLVAALGLARAAGPDSGRRRECDSAAVSANADRKAALTYYLVILAGLIGPGIFFLVNARFRAVIVCLMTPLAACAIVQAVGWCRRGVDRRKAFGAAALLAAVAVFSNSNLFGYRPPCHPYLLFIYAAACGATGRSDDMARTVEKIERAMATGVKGGGHGRALYCLYDYYDTKGALDKALYYGQQMMARQQLDPESVKRVFATFMRADRPDLVRQLLGIMNQGFTGRDRVFLAGALLDYARRYDDRAALAQAAECYRRLASEFPSEVAFHDRTELIVRLLAGPTSSRSAGSRPASRP
jgi:hypothetical protein